MRDTDPQGLPDTIEHAYEVLVADIERRREGIDREHAYEILQDDEGFEDRRADAKYAVKYLLKQGYLYEADGKLRVADSGL